MRKSIIILIFCFFILSCNDNTGDESAKNISRANTSVQIDTAINIEYSNIIPSKEAMEYIRNYKKKYIDSPELGSKALDRPKRKMTKAVWFRRDFINYIYSELQRDTSVDGVRIHLGAYTKSHPEGMDDREDYKDQISLFWMATRKVVEGDSVYHKDDTTFFQKPKKFLATANHGQLCPNQCKGVTQTQ